MSKSAKSAALRAVPREASVPISAPSPRQGVLWTPALLRQVLRRADAGDMALLANLCDCIMADDRFGALLGQLADDVLGCDLTFERSLRTSVGSAPKSAELEADWEVGYDDDELRNLIAWTLVTGVGFAKHEAWRETDSGRVVPALKWWHPQHFSWRVKDGHPHTGDQRHHSWHVREPGTERWTPIAAGDGTWVIVTKGGEWRPWANGLWRGLGAWWLLKQYAQQDAGIHSEKSAKLVATASPESTADEREAVANYIYEAGKDAVIALPIGFDLKLIETNANVDQIYGAQIRMADEAASIAILGQNLSTNVQEGSRAAAQVHDKKENRRVRNAAWMIAKPIKLQSLSWWSEFNFGTRDFAAYPFWHTEPPEDFAEKAAGLKTLADALTGLKTAGYKLPLETIEEEYGVVLEEHEEEPDPEDPDGGGAPVEDEEPAEDDAAADGADAVEDDPTSEASAAGVYLASGDDPDEAPGFVHGQLYVDDLSERCVSRAADNLTGMVARITAAIDGAEDYESIRHAVLKAFQAEADPDQLADIVHAGLVLANLSGRHSVLEDLPEDAEPSVDARQTELFPDLTAAVQHYPAGSSKGGQFMPKNGSAGSATKAKKAPGGAKKAAGGGGGAAAGAKPKAARKKAAAPKGAPKKKAAKKPAAKAKVAKKPAAKRKAAKRKAGGDSSAKPAAAKPRKAAKKKASTRQAASKKKPAAAKRSRPAPPKPEHDPAHHAQRLKAQYGEAASTVAWGHAMAARGRDMPMREYHARVDMLKASGVGVFDHREHKALIGSVKAKTAGELEDKLRATRPGIADRIAISSKLAAHHQALDGQRSSVATLGTLTHTTGSKISAKQAQGIVDEASAFYGAMSHQSLVHPTDYAWHANERLRGAASPAKRTVNLGVGLKDASLSHHKGTAIHEWAHVLEAANPRLTAKSVEFIEARAKGALPKKMSKLTGDARYKKHEVTQEDEFWHPYVGKVYSGSKGEKGYAEHKGRYATEVTSMGVQFMHDNRIISRINKRDPDTVNFALGQLANQ